MAQNHLFSLKSITKQTCHGQREKDQVKGMLVERQM